MVRPIRALLRGSGPSRYVSVHKNSEEFIEELYAAGGRSISSIHDGSFINGIDGWYPTTENTTLTYSGHALNIDRSDGSNFTVHYIPDGLSTISLINADFVDFLYDAKCQENDSILLVGQIRFWSDAFQLTSVGSAVQRPSPAGTSLSADYQTFGVRKYPVPEGATHISISFIGQTSDNHPVSITNIVLTGTSLPLEAIDQPALFPTRVGNSDFEENIDHWYPWKNTETLSQETINPISGSGSLKVITPGGATEQGVIYTYDQQPFVLPEENLKLDLKLRGSGTLKVQLWYKDGDDTIEVWTGTVSTNPTIVSEVITMPSTEYAVPTSILILTTTDQAITFFIDDVSLAAAPS